MRLTLEKFSIPKAVERMDDADFAELAKEVWMMSEAARTNDLQKSVDADIRFHELLLERSGQPHAAQVWRSIAPRIRAYFFRYGRSNLQRVAEEHRELLQALQTREPDVIAARARAAHRGGHAGAHVTALLRVENLRTWFDSDRGPIRAVDGVDFEIESGRTLGVVGESGSGKSVTALSVMRLVDDPGHIADESRIVFDGRDLAGLDEREMEHIRGDEISMIFQEPMTSLNPVYTVGDQIAEAVRSHESVGASEASARAVEMLELVGHPGGGAARERLSAPALGRDAAARDDRRSRSRATRSC